MTYVVIALVAVAFLYISGVMDMAKSDGPLVTLGYFLFGAVGAVALVALCWGAHFCAVLLGGAS